VIRGRLLLSAAVLAAERITASDPRVPAVRALRAFGLSAAETRRRAHGLPQATYGHREKFGNDPAKHRDLSAVAHVASGKCIPPFLIMHVAEHPDTGAQAQRLAGVLKGAGVPVRVSPLRAPFRFGLVVLVRELLLLRCRERPRGQASLLERLPGKLLTRDQLLLLAQDNVIAKGGFGLADPGRGASASAEHRVDRYFSVEQP